MRTINDLSKLNGRVYVYLANTEIGNRFLQQAEEEGFTYHDGVKPTDRGCLTIMAVNREKTINFVGANGFIAFGSGAKAVGSEQLIRIDGEKYLSGADDYLYN